ncbi:hypothetical protein BYT27DRAFT_7185146 [Phlegmacium glaucopus]|nr:hypothetical protein BYT27DRAFT_7185146 [Phlegmacium glaucopus]
MKLGTRVSKALLVLRDKDIPQRLEISEKDVVIFVIGSTGSGKSTFINTALAKKSMVVSEPSALVSCTKSIQMFKCTSPWNPFGRSVIFVDMPAFNHSKLDVQRRVPDLINAWLEVNCRGKSVDSGILYLHAMLPRLNEGFDKHLDPFIKLCHEKGHRPISALLISTMWPTNRGTEESAHIKELEEHFRKSTADVRKMPNSRRFDMSSHNSAIGAIDALLQDIMVVKGEKDPDGAM